MRKRDVPKRAKCPNVVAGKNPHDDYLLALESPAEPCTPEQRRARSAFSIFSVAWGTMLPTGSGPPGTLPGKHERPRINLGQLYSLTGQAYFIGVNSARARLGLGMLLDPPARRPYVLSPVQKLIISYTGGRLTLKLQVSEPVPENFVFLGQDPCSPGRTKCRHPSSSAPCPPPWTACATSPSRTVKRFGNPPAGSRVFIRTRQQPNGRKPIDLDVTALVPANPPPAARRKHP